jgi:hypothetical protein
MIVYLDTQRRAHACAAPPGSKTCQARSRARAHGRTPGLAHSARLHRDAHEAGLCGVHVARASGAPRGAMQGRATQGRARRLAHLDAPAASRKAPSAEKTSEVKHWPDVLLPAARRSAARRPPAMSRRPSIVPWRARRGRRVRRARRRLPPGDRPTCCAPAPARCCEGERGRPARAAGAALLSKPGACAAGARERGRSRQEHSGPRPGRSAPGRACSSASSGSQR